MWLQPRVIVHSAAIRRPDEIGKNESQAKKINVVATEQIAGFAGTDD